MKKIVDEKTKTIWYYSESGFPFYMAIDFFRRRNPFFLFPLLVKNVGKNYVRITNQLK